MLTDYYFWFAQPSLILSNADRGFFYGFAALIILSLLIWVGGALSKNPIFKGMLRRWRTFLLSTGFAGMVWFVFRYESTPIFAKRFWAGLVIVGGLVWLFFVLKYTFGKYRAEKKDYAANQLKSKYMPKSR